jgi:hypothetical protein
MDERFAASEAKMEARFASTDARLNSVDARFDASDAKNEQRFVALDTKLTKLTDDFVELRGLLKAAIWAIGLVGSVITLMAAVVGAVQWF